MSDTQSDVVHIDASKVIVAKVFEYDGVKVMVQNIGTVFQSVFTLRGKIYQMFTTFSPTIEGIYTKVEFTRCVGYQVEMARASIDVITHGDDPEWIKQNYPEGLDAIEAEAMTLTTEEEQENE